MFYMNASWYLCSTQCVNKSTNALLTNYKQDANLICFAFEQQGSNELQALSE